MIYLKKYIIDLKFFYSGGVLFFLLKIYCEGVELDILKCTNTLKIDKLYFNYEEMISYKKIYY